MTDKKPAQNPDFAPTLAALLARHHLSEARGAGLLGVPVFTLRKWLTGQRAPSAAAVRLVAVLDLLAVLAPGLLAGLIPAPVPAAPRGRGKKAVLVEQVPSNSGKNGVLVEQVPSDFGKNGVLVEQVPPN